MNSFYQIVMNINTKIFSYVVNDYMIPLFSNKYPIFLINI